MSKIKKSLSVFLLCGTAIISACNKNQSTASDPSPDFTGNSMVASGNETVSLNIKAWRAVLDQPCRIQITGFSLTNWVKLNGILPRLTLAPDVVAACLGEKPYLAAISSNGSAGPAVWMESSGPDSAVPVSRFEVKVVYLKSDRANLELRVLADN